MFGQFALQRPPPSWVSVVPGYLGMLIPCHAEVSIKPIKAFLHLVLRGGVVAEEGGLSVSNEGGFFIGLLPDVSGAGDALFRAEMAPEDGVITGAPVGEVILKGAWMSAQEFVCHEEEI